MSRKKHVNKKRLTEKRGYDRIQANLKKGVVGKMVKFKEKLYLIDIDNKLTGIIPTYF